MPAIGVMTPRNCLPKGIDPGEEKKQAREAVLAKEREERDTFEFVAREWFAKYEPTLSEKHAKKLRRYLENTIFPAIGGKPVTQLEPADFLQLVQPSERLGHHETAHKLMRLCGQVTRYARITGRVKYGPYLQDVYGLSKDVASSIVMCFTLGMIIGCPVSGWLSDKIVRSRKKVLLLGIILHTLVYIPLAFFTASIGTPTLLYLLFTLFGFTGGFFVVCFACVKETTEPRYAATAVGGLNMGIAVGAAFFQYVCGLIIDSHGKVGSVYGADAYASAFQLCMVMMIVGAVFMFFFKERKIQTERFCPGLGQ